MHDETSVTEGIGGAARDLIMLAILALIVGIASGGICATFRLALGR
jgi:hypothetical protein